MPKINLSDLPQKYQQQAMSKLGEQMRRKAEEQKRTKYGNIKAERAGMRFDSQKEARRFDELTVMQRAGEIRDLRLQVEFTLQAAYTTTEGERIRAIRYLADFTYYRRSGDGWEYIVEDVKSKATKTKTYAMKKKLMADRLGLTITEI